MKIAFIGVPIAQGADRRGVEKAPDFFRDKGVVSMLDSIAGCYDLGNVHSSVIAEEKYVANPDVKFLDTVVDVVTQLRDKVFSVINQGYFPLVVGGDHSLGLGSGAGAALASENIGIIWLDAHGDFNTEETSPSGNLHGMPCAGLLGWCNSSLNDVAMKRIPSHNIFWVGTRDLDDGEVRLMKEHQLNVYGADLIREKGINSILNEIIHKILHQNIHHIHLSIDVDVMDPSIICGTGTKVKNGIWNGVFYSLIDGLFDTGMVKSVDFVEYNPLLDDADLTTAKWCLEVLHYLGIKIKDVD